MFGIVVVECLIQRALGDRLTVLFVLLLVFFYRGLIEVLNTTISNSVPTGLILSLLKLNIPRVTRLVLPLDLFLKLLVALNGLCARDRVAMVRTYNLDGTILIGTTVVLTMFATVITTIGIV